tara:strand:- start:2098 stop:2463 length:366 start_codon:yes stop_codon:yes gene_type:complete
MATLKPTLTITNADSTTDALSITSTDSLTVGNPSVNTARTSIATGSAQALIPSNSAFSYVYLKIISSTDAAAWVQVKLGGDAKFKMKIGEFAFFPLYSSQAITAEAQTAACVVEYGYWTAA